MHIQNELLNSAASLYFDYNEMSLRFHTCLGMKHLDAVNTLITAKLDLG